MQRVAPCLVSIAALICAGSACSQEYPGKTIRIVTSLAGGGSDFVARVIAQAISGPLGQQVIVDNRSAGVIPGEIVSKSPPDGYTLLAYSSGLWTLPLLQKVPYDPQKDFLPVTMAVHAPNVMVVHPSVPAKNIKELIVLAKARPGELNYGSGGTGGSIHLGTELFKAMAGVNMVRVPYKGTGNAMIDLLAGQIQVMLSVAASVAPHAKTGKLRVLGVTSAQRSPLAPGVPTIAESGVPGYELTAITGLFAPARTPPQIIERLNREMVQALGTPEVKERFFRAGVETVGSSPAELAATISSEMIRLGKVIREAGIGVQ